MRQMPISSGCALVDLMASDRCWHSVFLLAVVVVGVTFSGRSTDFLRCVYDEGFPWAYCWMQEKYRPIEPKDLEKSRWSGMYRSKLEGVVGCVVVFTARLARARIAPRAETRPRSPTPARNHQTHCIRYRIIHVHVPKSPSAAFCHQLCHIALHAMAACRC